MQFSEFGNMEGKTLMLLPGTGCTWELNFKYVVEDLAKKFHIIGVNYDGFETDPDIRTEFTDMLTITSKIEDYIRENHNGQIDGAYGSSLGGSFVGLLFERNKIHINHGFIGSSDLDEGSKFVAWLATVTVGNIIENSMVNEKKFNRFKKLLTNGNKDEEKNRVMGDFLQMFSESIKQLAPGTLKKEFYSDYSTRLGKNIDVENAKIHVIYALGMGKKYEKRYRTHFKNPDIIKFDMNHEAWLFSKDASAPVLNRVIKEMED